MVTPEQFVKQRRRIRNRAEQERRNVRSQRARLEAEKQRLLERRNQLERERPRIRARRVGESKQAREAFLARERQRNQIISDINSDISRISSAQASLEGEEERISKVEEEAIEKLRRARDREPQQRRYAVDQEGNVVAEFLPSGQGFLLDEQGQRIGSTEEIFFTTTPTERELKMSLPEELRFRSPGEVRQAKVVSDRELQAQNLEVQPQIRARPTLREEFTEFRERRGQGVIFGGLGFVGEKARGFVSQREVRGDFGFQRGGQSLSATPVIPAVVSTGPFFIPAVGPALAISGGVENIGRSIGEPGFREDFTFGQKAFATGTDVFAVGAGALAGRSQALRAEERLGYPRFRTGTIQRNVGRTPSGATIITGTTEVERIRLLGRNRRFLVQTSTIARESRITPQTSTFRASTIASTREVFPPTIPSSTRDPFILQAGFARGSVTRTRGLFVRRPFVEDTEFGVLLARSRTRAPGVPVEQRFTAGEGFIFPREGSFFTTLSRIPGQRPGGAVGFSATLPRARPSVPPSGLRGTERVVRINRDTTANRAFLDQIQQQTAVSAVSTTTPPVPVPRSPVVSTRVQALTGRAQTRQIFGGAQLPDTRQRLSQSQIPGVRLRQPQRQRFRFRQGIVPRLAQPQRVDFRQSQAFRQAIVPRTRIRQVQRPGRPTIPAPVTPRVPPPTTPKIPGGFFPPLPKFNTFAGPRTFGVGARQSFADIPSFGAFVFNIRGPRVRRTTGLEFQPLFPGFRRQIARRRKT